MTWVLQDTYSSVDTSGGDLTSTGLEGLFDWVVTRISGRGFTCEKHLDDPAIGYIFRKDVICTDGQAQTLEWGLGVHWAQMGATETIYHYNPGVVANNTAAKISADTKAAAGSSSSNDIASESWNMDGTYQFWASDVDSESFIIIQDNGATKHVRWIEPVAGSRIRQDYATATNNPRLKLSLMPFSEFTNVRRTSSSETLYINQLSESYYQGQPFVTHGHVPLLTGTGHIAQMFQEDISQFQDYSRSSNGLYNYEATQLNTLRVQGQFYIRWGSLSGNTQLLLNTGTVNPNL